MSDDDNIPVQKDESRHAFLRYLPKRIVAFEQRMQRYRREGWDHNGMTVLRGDLLRLGDASSHHGLLDTCRHLLILARMVGEHVTKQTAPDPQQAFRMFAELSKVSESLPALGEMHDHPGTSETTQEAASEHAALAWQVEPSTAPPVAKSSVPAAAAAIESVDPVSPIGLAAPIEWELAEPAADVEPIEVAAPIEQAGSIEWELAEPSADAEADEAAAPVDPPEPVAQQLAEPSAHAEVVQTAAPIEPSVPIQPFEPELAEPIAHADPVETVIAPPKVEAVEPPVPVDLPAQVGLAPVEPSEAADAVDLFDPDEMDEPDMGGEAGVRRVFYLNDGNAFAIELGKRLESEGYAIEPVESVDELSEMLMCLMPQMLLVDASHMSDLDAIDKVRRETQQRSQTQRRIQLVALAAQDNLETRRVAHRAEVEELLFPPFDIADVVGRLHNLDAATEEQQVRVLIVDDERVDALFALTVLNRAGMRAHVEIDPKRVLESIKAMHPDLVLMDLHMPFVNGVELTLLIREDPVFARLPIVFLSGESDPDSRLEAINAGGDDFLFKPIRPRHLIAAVRERMRRLHPVSKQVQAAGASDDPAGIQRRA
jgi:DNA-binding response OmpR family regulator